MATAFYRLGRAAYRRRRLVLATWVVLLVGAIAAAATLSGSTNETFSTPGTESQQANDLLDKRLPDANGADGRIVFAAPEGERLTGGERRAAIEAALADVARAPEVIDTADPFAAGLVSRDGRVALAQVTWGVPEDDVDAEMREDVAGRAGAAARDAGLQVEFGGAAAPDGGGEGGIAELAGVGVAALVLAITFGSLLAAGLPLLTAVIGVAISLMGITAMSGFVDLNSNVSTLAMMLGLAVGIDYALFILARHRAQLFTGMDPEESAGRAAGTAGSAVVFAGATVVIALAALAVVNIPFLTSMGLAAAAAVVIAVAVALTLVPALFGFAGTRLLRGKNFETGERAQRPTLGARWAALVVRRRWPALALCTIALGACAIPMLDMRLGLPDDSTAAPQDTNRKAYDLLTDAFGPGFNGPLTIVVDAGEGGAAARAADAVAVDLRRHDDVESVARPLLNRAGDTAIISLVPRSGPSSEATKQLVEDVRDRADTLGPEVGADVLLTGTTAVNIDVSQRLSDALLPYLAVIVGLAFLLLAIAFRSVLVPLTAVGGFLLTIGAAFGAVVAVFQNGFAADLLGVAQEGPIMSLMPVLIIGILFGLAMDYQVFLVTRMREEHVHGATPTRAVTDGFRHSARVVTGAALIMTAVFASFIVERDAVIKSVGFALAFGILVDAFVVRMTLIPALMAVLGERAWWLPRWLDRVLPRVDVEGEQLTRRFGPPRPVEPAEPGTLAVDKKMV
ncbi:MMPL family transporter [Conexibacter woesei]|uniref:MMPL domain protein n=1 Tax=Conexibacter woesei (strain DSM 14684 / CCUG 47730 / CIP 108061 / JCM 11494 / NBRC 100937 / ID131577) TaxID=469383 RepID=D3F8B6_CONWI|nr:MMPL family transporter [Conexibacter woesei]ADB48986.1 MMPL domain protein [Conexibacter woesei DSM 14684]